MVNTMTNLKKWRDLQIGLYREMPPRQDSLYVRTEFRNDADLRISEIRVQKSAVESPKFNRLIESLATYHFGQERSRTEAGEDSEEKGCRRATQGGRWRQRSAQPAQAAPPAVGAAL